MGHRDWTDAALTFHLLSNTKKSVSFSDEAVMEPDKKTETAEEAKLRRAATLLRLEKRMNKRDKSRSETNSNFDSSELTTPKQLICDSTQWWERRSGRIRPKASISNVRRRLWNSSSTNLSPNKIKIDEEEVSMPVKKKRSRRPVIPIWSEKRLQPRQGFIQDSNQSPNTQNEQKPGQWIESSSSSDHGGWSAELNDDGTERVDSRNRVKPWQRAMPRLSDAGRKTVSELLRCQRLARHNYRFMADWEESAVAALKYKEQYSGGGVVSVPLCPFVDRPSSDPLKPDRLAEEIKRSLARHGIDVNR